MELIEWSLKWRSGLSFVREGGNETEKSLKYIPGFKVSKKWEKKNLKENCTNFVKVYSVHLRGAFWRNYKVYANMAAP
jgi:hypothetical protein